MENLAEDYDGFFDLTCVKKQTAVAVESLIDDVCDKGMSKDAYVRGNNVIPGMFGQVDERRLTSGYSRQQQGVAVEAFGSVLNMLPIVRVTEENGIITVGGIPAKMLATDIYRHWKTNRITNNIFTKRGHRSFSFYSYFAVEVVYMLKSLLAGSKRTRASLIEAIVSELETKTWLADVKDAKPLNFKYDRLNELSCTLLPKQHEFLENYAENVPRCGLTGWMLAAAPGTGKTIAGYAFSLVADFDVTIIVSPKNAVHDVWEKTIHERFKKQPNYWLSTSGKPITGKEDYIICHYDQLKNLLNQVNKLRGKRVGVWLDESHNLNELTAQRCLTFIRICQEVNAEHVVWASGTPLKAIGKEVVPLFRTIDPLFTPEVEEVFIKIFGATKGQALDVLSNRMKLATFQVTKDDVVINEKEEYVQYVEIPNAQEFTLPAVREEIKAFVIERAEYYKRTMPEHEAEYFRCLKLYEKLIESPDEQRDYNNYLSYVNKMHKRFDPTADKDSVVWCKQFERKYIYDKLTNEDRKVFRRVSSVYKYVSLTIRGEALGRILTRRRIDCFKAMVPYAGLEDIIETSETKTLIFTSYVDVAHALNSEVGKLGYTPLMVYGETNRELVSIMAKFKSDAKANPMIATYDSLSTAVPVIEASTCLLFNSPFREYIRNQATSRVDRLGQKAKVRIVSTILDTGNVANLSSRSLDIANWSKEQVDAILNLDSNVADAA